MIKQFETIRKTRSYLLEDLKDLTTEQFNKIPEGFNNNIIWNLGHLVATQQIICYISAGLDPKINEEFINAYRKGAKPERPVDATEIENIKTLLFSTLDQLEADYNSQIFGGYAAWSTRYGIELASVDDTINFLPFHEGLHSGCITALKRLVN